MPLWPTRRAAATTTVAQAAATKLAKGKEAAAVLRAANIPLPSGLFWRPLLASSLGRDTGSCSAVRRRDPSWCRCTTERGMPLCHLRPPMRRAPEEACF